MAHTYKKLIRNYAPKTFYSIAEVLASPLAILISTPILYSHLGIHDFALWSTANVIAGICQILTLGTSFGLVSFVAEDIGEKEYGRAIDIGRSALTLTFIVFFILILATGLLYSTISKYLFDAAFNSREISLTITAALAAMLIQEVDVVITNQIKGRGSYSLAAAVEVGGRVFWMALIAFAVLTGSSLNSIFYYHLSALSLKMGFKIYFLAKIASSFKILLPTRNKLSFKRLIAFAKWQSLQVFGAIMFNSVDKFMVGNIFGAMKLSEYVICSQIAQAVHLVQAAAFQVLYQKISGIKHQIREKRKLLTQISIVGGIATMLLPLLMLTILPRVLAIWISPEFSTKNQELAAIIMLVYGALAITIPSHYILMALGEVKYCAISVLLAGLLTAAACYFVSGLGLHYFTATRAAFALVVIGYIYRISNKSLSKKIYKDK